MNQRKIVVHQKVADGSRHFRDAKTQCEIVCAFNPDGLCSPNCAACHIYGTQVKAECLRGGTDKEFQIGVLDE